MKAVVYNGPRDVAVTDVDDARIERPSDAMVRITTTNICGSDLHMYEGRTDFERGRTFGHENLGQVIEVGEDVERLQVDDWVCLPFNIACGKCVNCNRGLTNYCNFWFRGQKMGTGQCPVKRYNRHLRNLIHAGKAQPSFIVSHHLPLDEAPEGYEHFDSRDDGWTKVLLHPNGTS
jgi:threonine dehydrogenase-like Zn-dependent dehydrogenase